MKNLLVSLLAVLLFATASHADNFGMDLSSTSPASPTTAVGYTTSTQIGMYTTCSFYALVQGGTGGTLDVFIQTAFKQVNSSPVWADVAHLPQIAAGAALAGYSFTLSRWMPNTSTITTGLNTAPGTPAITANTVIPGMLGYLLRVVYKTGAGTSVGAQQTILAYCSNT